MVSGLAPRPTSPPDPSGDSPLPSDFFFLFSLDEDLEDFDFEVSLSSTPSPLSADFFLLRELFPFLSELCNFFYNDESHLLVKLTSNNSRN